MSILQVVKDVCAVVGVQLPQSVFAALSTNRTMQEMLALANEMAQRIAYETRDWSKLRATAVLTGDGVTSEFDLPADYKRMLLTANVWRSTSSLTPMMFVPDSDEWLQRRLNNESNAFGEWTMQGGKIVVWPVMGVTETARFVYLKKNPVNIAAGGVGERFIADDDSFTLEERLLTLGMIWQWKANKGTPYQEDMSTYGDALTYAMGKDSPSPIILGRKPVSVNARVAYPWPVPSP